jgi:hypothetical protein
MKGIPFSQRRIGLTQSSPSSIPVRFAFLMVRLSCSLASKTAQAFRTSLPRVVMTVYQTGRSILGQHLPLSHRTILRKNGASRMRIVYLAELEQHAVTYTAYSARSSLVSLALTRDFKTFQRRGMIMPPEGQGCSLLSPTHRRKMGAYPPAGHARLERRHLSLIFT